jgi:hypothetical protein
LGRRFLGTKGQHNPDEAVMQKYLVAFRDLGKDYFVTDCGFDNYCDAVCYAAQVLQVAGSQTAEARIWDSATKTLVLQLTRGDQATI